MKTKLFILTMLCCGMGIASFAQNAATPGVRERQENQIKRIKQGHRSGELTKRETLALAKQQDNIRDNKQAARADGVVTKRERAQLHHQQNRASRSIARQKRDAQDRN